MTNWYEYNLSLIKDIDPDLAQRISGHNKCEDFEVEIVESKSEGYPTLKVKKEDREIFLHSFYNPLMESTRWAKNVAQKGEDKIAIIGFGLGYHVEEYLTDRDDYGRVLVIEPQIGLFKKALQARDLSKIFLNKSLSLAIGEEKRGLEKKLSYVFSIGQLEKAEIETLPSYARTFEKTYEKVRKTCIEVFKSVRVEENTLLYFSGLWPENFFKNLCDIVKSPGVKNLFGKGEKKPGIIISAGPSLGKNRHLLKEAKGKAILICVDTALRALLKVGIKPDLVIALDGSELNYKHFIGIEDVDDVPLVFFPTVHHKIPHNYCSAKIVALDGTPLTAWATDLIDEKGHLQYGGSVATAAFDLAVQMNCDPVIFVGQDLSYPGGKSHADGTINQDKIIDDKGPNKLYVEDIEGNQVLTDIAMHTFLKWFENAIEKHKNTRLFIDATEGGAKINGTEIMTLRDTLDKYCIDEFNPETLISEIVDNYNPEKVDVIYNALEEAIIALKTLEENGIKGVDFAEAMEKEYNKVHINQSRIIKLIKKMDNVDKQIKDEENNYLLNIILQRIFLIVLKGPLSKAEENETEKQKGIRIAKRSKVLYEGIKEASIIMHDHMVEARDEIKNLLPKV